MKNKETINSTIRNHLILKGNLFLLLVGITTSLSTLGVTMSSNQAFASNSAYYDVIQADSPIAYWRTLSSGHILDETSYNNDITSGIGSTVSSNSSSPILNSIDPKSLQFSSTGTKGIITPINKLDFTNWGSSTGWSWEWWAITTTVTQVQQDMLSLNNAHSYSPVNDNQWAVNWIKDKYRLMHDYGGNQNTSVNSPLASKNVWNHYVLTVNSSSAKVYRDGQEIINYAGTQPVIQDDAVLALAAYKGSTFPTGDYYSLKGKMSEIAIYDYSLLPNQIQEHYELGKYGLNIDYPITNWTRSDIITNPIQPLLSGDKTGWEYEVASGYALPDGLVLNQYTGEITGTPVSQDEVNTDYIEMKVKAIKGSNSILSNLFNIIVRPESPAQQLRPILLFDTDEKWRPLNVETLVNEEYSGSPAIKHQLCDPSCSSITGLEELDETGVEGDRLDLNGDTDTLGLLDLPGVPSGLGMSLNTDTDSYMPANDSCLTGSRQECDDISSLYWQAIPDSEGDFYYDYWAYYRYNKYNLSNFDELQPYLYLFAGFSLPVGVLTFDELDAGNHEGDWEGLVVASDNQDDPTGFDWVGMDSHGSTWKYLPGVLYCNSVITEEPCLKSDGLKGQRVVAYVAEGSHATYPRPCNENCNQTDSEGEAPWGVDVPDPIGLIGFASERDFDGEVNWSHNNSENRLTEMPTSFNEWADWNGFWGGEESEVRSPRDQDRGSEPWLAGVCTDRYSETEECEDPFSRNSIMTSEQKACAPWSGPFIQVSVCNSKALDTQTNESLVLIKEKLSDSYKALTGSASGVSQLISDIPLNKDERIQLIGSIPKNTIIIVKTKNVNAIVKETTFMTKELLSKGIYSINLEKQNGEIEVNLMDKYSNQAIKTIKTETINEINHIKSASNNNKE
jgi:hypothetical protein